MAAALRRRSPRTSRGQSETRPHATRFLENHDLLDMDPSRWKKGQSSMGNCLIAIDRRIVVKANFMTNRQTSSKSAPGAAQIQSAKGTLGVMIRGMGAVASTFVAGVEAIRRRLAQPIGSLTQMGTIRLGKRTERRSPKIKDFVPLADLKDLVFAAWDPIPDDAYAAAVKAGVLERHEHLEPIKDFTAAA